MPLIELGSRQSGPAGFGLRRVLLDQSGKLKSALQRGEHESLQTDRVILVPGTDAEVATDNQMFQWLIQDDLAISAIASRLNGLGVLTDLDRPYRSPPRWKLPVPRTVIKPGRHAARGL